MHFTSPTPRSLVRAFTLALGLLAACACGRSGPSANTALRAPRSHAALAPFSSEAELAAYMKSLRAKVAAPPAQYGYPQSAGVEPSAAPEAASAPATASASSADQGSDAEEESVTNTQHAGVDEGGIVKVHGDHLVVLRRGRLFTVEIENGELTPISRVDAFGPDVDPSGAWYDEMLLSDDTVAVIGYSYERGGTEVGLFDISRNGKLAHRATYHLRSNDYYSSRNYASRLIGDKLIFYSPLYLSLYDAAWENSLPAMRKWHRRGEKGEFKRIASAERVYRPATPLVNPQSLALHTVTVCDLGSREMDCRATSVMGPAGRVFYVSPSSVYVWVTDYGGGSSQRSHLYRLPLDGTAPSALQVSGSPVDQFSFLESADGHLNVLVRSEAVGDGMWGAEVAEGEVALMRVLLQSFGTGGDRVPQADYARLPKPEGDTFQNRFVGDHVLYGTGSGWGEPETKKVNEVYAVRYASGGVTRVPLGHGVDRIEALGSDAVVVGSHGEDLHFTPVRLAARPGAARSYVRANASQGELRSHGFFYKREGEDTGLIGLSIAEAGRPGYEHLFQSSASILFLGNESLRFTELGTLGARPEGASDDHCKASCVDWYGNARPLFLKDRVFALLGYEIVEGRLERGKIRESRRVSFAPERPAIAR